MPATRQAPARAARIRLLVLDVDGVLTDGTLVYGPSGEETKRFHVRDGLALQLARSAGIEIAILSGRQETVELLDRILPETGEDPEAWIPAVQQRRKQL